MEKPVFEPEVSASNPVEATDVLEFRYQKSPQFRIIHCDGAYGGFTPKGLFGLSLYAERAQLPDKTVLNMNEQGNLTERHEPAKRDVIRQVEATVLLSADQAETLGRWILEHVRRVKGNEVHLSTGDE